MLPILFSIAVSGYQAPPAKLTAQQDHQRLLKELGIESLRPGVNGMDPKAPNFANTDEAKANPYPNIPEVLRFNDGKPVKNRGDWSRRRDEIQKSMDREIYGRTPKNLPKVKWEVENQGEGEIGGIAV